MDAITPSEIGSDRIFHGSAQQARPHPRRAQHTMAALKISLFDVVRESERPHIDEKHENELSRYDAFSMRMLLFGSFFSKTSLRYG